ncbi:tetraacyldisaccharide 4'-kinase [Aquisalimonas asiatica]|uniref:Tetraacyldisaccharide 4'-kinase n=1 Tax=Aquisalimonas asiatica TaxID=406100 RepID=A0A1H8QER7_9GAMM|nr:tetraacyldisaccharide 4'-kinase [Aquisalimonas asiatica]SEO52725.1 lipid-A-disaccharide kinase [Aquisalimonas asiatica]
MTGFPQFWLRNTPRSLLLLPASWLYRIVAFARRSAYRWGVLGRERIGVPVLVIGNIFVGGTGKTPLVLWMVRYLRAMGKRPGIITRGYGGQAKEWPQVVHEDSDPLDVGDEPVLLAQRGGCPVVASPDRVDAARTLVEEFGCDVVVSDDGLQHYRLMRDMEVVVVDAARGLGNGHCLPAGPLREPRSRLRTVDLLVANGGPSWLTPYYFTLRLNQAVGITDVTRSRSLTDFAGEQAHAIAGIGNPDRFFAALGRYGIEVIQHPFADHYPFAEKDITFDDDLPVLMTEKDAVKCRPHASERHWAVPAETVLTAETERAMKARVRAALERFQTGRKRRSRA